MKEYKVRVTIEDTFEITVKASDKDEAVEKANEIDFDKWRLCDSNTVDELVEAVK